MKRTLAAAAAGAALVLPVTLVTAGPAAAAPNAAASCPAKGVTTLAALGASKAAATGTLDYSAFADAQDGPIFLDLPEGSFIPKSDVIALHRTNPELFAWCR